MKRTLACMLAVLLLVLPLAACQSEETASTPVSTVESTPTSSEEVSSESESSAIAYTGTPGDAAWPANVPMPLEELAWGLSPEKVAEVLTAYTADGTGFKSHMDHNTERLTGIRDYSADLYGLPAFLMITIMHWNSITCCPLATTAMNRAHA